MLPKIEKLSLKTLYPGYAPVQNVKIKLGGSWGKTGRGKEVNR